MQEKNAEATQSEKKMNLSFACLQDKKGISAIFNKGKH